MDELNGPQGCRGAFSLRGGRVVDPLAGRVRRGEVFVDDGKFVCGEDQACTERAIDVRGLFVAPGFIDLQVNGAVGFDFAYTDPAGMRAAADWCMAHGTTGFLATLVSAPCLRLRQAMSNVARAAPPAVLGVHLEGPFISPKQKGAHEGSHILPPSLGRLENLLEGYEGYVRLMTLAPELPGADEVIDRVLAAGAVPALGHSDANYGQALAAVDRGVRGFTHLFNAMRPFHHREPGPVGAALDTDAYVELICDGVHVHPAAVRLAAKVKGFDRICLVSDAMAAAGLPDGAYALGGRPVAVCDGEARLADGTLAGSTLSMNLAVKHFMDWTACSLPEAVRCSSLNPARLLGLDERKGSLDEGKDADLVVFDEEFTVHHTIVGGRVVFSRDQGRQKRT